MTTDFKPFSFDKRHLNINPSARDLAVTQKDYAIFLPSISSIYARIASMQQYRVRETIPAGLVNGLKDLNFLDPNNSLVYYPIGLYSAGHAILDPAESWEIESMIQQRDRKNTLIIGDSGGFQAATGVLKYPWNAKANQSAEDLARSQDDVRMKILRWLEATSDYSMGLDWPTSALTRHGVDPVTGDSLHPSLKNFGDCLRGSLENYEFFIKHRVPGATKFLNPLQGRTQAEGDIWWDAVKDLPFESWAFAGSQASNMTINLRRLIIMRDDNYLQGREWLHYLGNGKIKASCVFTTLQRTLRKYVDPNLTVSYDAASPFRMVAKGSTHYGHILTPYNLTFKSGSIVDSKELKNSTQILNDWLAENMVGSGNCVPSTIGSRLTVGDICVRSYDDLDYKKIAFTKKELESEEYINSLEGKAGDKFRWSKDYKDYLIHHPSNGGLFDFGSDQFTDEKKKYEIKWPSALDALSYLCFMNHNVELHINAIQTANMYQDLPLDEAKQYIPSDILEFKDLCPEIFTSERPMDLIMKHEKMLQKITGIDADNPSSLDIEDL